MAWSTEFGGEYEATVTHLTAGQTVHSETTFTGDGVAGGTPFPAELHLVPGRVYQATLEIIDYDPNTAAVDEQLATVSLQWQEHGFAGPTWSSQSGIGVQLNEGDEWPTDNADFEDIMGQSLTTAPYEYGNVGGETEQTVHMDIVTTWNCCSGGSVTVRVTIAVLADPNPDTPPEPPAPTEGVGFDLHEPDLTFVESLDSLRNKTIRVELDGTGGGNFEVNRNTDDWIAIATNLNNAGFRVNPLVRCTIPRIWEFPIFAFYIEEVESVLASDEEQGGEIASCEGRGALSYLEHARMRANSYVTGGNFGVTGTIRLGRLGTGTTPGSNLMRVLRENTHPDRPGPPLSLLTTDMNYDDDSSGDPWDTVNGIEDFTADVGEDVLSIVGRLITLGLIVQMGPDLDFHAYNEGNFGRDLTGASFGAGVVRFEKGVNIQDEIKRDYAGVTETHMIVQGDADDDGNPVYRSVGYPPSGPPAGALRVEGFVSTHGTDPTHLDSFGQKELQRRRKAKGSTAFKVITDRVDRPDPSVLEAVGFYLPGPEGSNGHYWVGDTVTLHTGTGPDDFNEASVVIHAITIEHTDANELEVTVEVEGPAVHHVRFWRPGNVALGGAAKSLDDPFAQSRG